MPPPIKQLDMVVIERVLQMGAGYVLNFSDPRFRDFFLEHSVQIDYEKYRVDGPSKARRLRVYLKTATPEEAANVLEGLLEHRLVQPGDEVAPTDLEHYRTLIAALRGVDKRVPAETTETELLRRAFSPETFATLPVDPEVAELLVDRMNEAHQDIGAGSFLSAVIMCGSTLEGMCLGYGRRNTAEVNKTYAAQYGKVAPRFRDWALYEWIQVLERMNVLSPNISKFGQALRDFRNYIHPAEQLAAKFKPDLRTAQISFHVVVAAAEDLVKAVATQTTRA